MAQEQQTSSTSLDPQNTCFLIKLDEEKLKHKEHRHEFVKQKLMFIIGLFSIGSLNSGNPFDFSVLLYFIPFVALAYDVFIFSEDFKVKRIGLFIRTQDRYKGSAEADWENWLKKVPKYREKTSLYASIGLTLITMASSSYMLCPKNQNGNVYLYSWWFAASLLMGVVVFGYSLYRRSQLLANQGISNTGRSIEEQTLAEDSP